MICPQFLIGVFLTRRPVAEISYFERNLFLFLAESEPRFLTYVFLTFRHPRHRYRSGRANAYVASTWQLGFLYGYRPEDRPSIHVTRFPYYGTPTNNRHCLG